MKMLLMCIGAATTALAVGFVNPTVGQLAGSASGYREPGAGSPQSEDPPPATPVCILGSCTAEYDYINVYYQVNGYCTPWFPFDNTTGHYHQFEVQRYECVMNRNPNYVFSYVCDPITVAPFCMAPTTIPTCPSGSCTN